MKKKWLFILLLLILAVAVCACEPAPSYKITSANGENSGEGDIILQYGDYTFLMEQKDLYLFKTVKGEITLISETKLPYCGDEMVITSDGVAVIGTGSYSVVLESKEDDGENGKGSFGTTEITIFPLPTDDEYKFEEKTTYTLYGRFFNAKYYNEELYVSARYPNNDLPVKDALHYGAQLSVRTPLIGIDIPDFDSEYYGAAYYKIAKNNITGASVNGNLIDFFIDGGEIVSILNSSNSAYNRGDTSAIILHGSDLQAKGIYKENGYRVCDRFSAAVNGDKIYFATFNRENGTNFTVLDSESLEKVGEIRGLAPGEELTSANFGGNYFYLTTVLRETVVDPVYKIDISNPQNPKVVSELKIEGFSSHLQIVDEKFAIGFRSGELKLYTVDETVKAVDTYIAEEDNDFLSGDNRAILLDEDNGRFFIFTLGNYVEEGEKLTEITESGTEEELDEWLKNVRHVNQLLVISYGESGFVLNRTIELESGVWGYYFEHMTFDGGPYRTFVKDGYLYVTAVGRAYSFDLNDFSVKCVIDYGKYE